MTRLIVDTCVFSYIFKGDTRAEIYRDLLTVNEPCLSFMSVAELYRWAVTRKWGVKQIESLKGQIAGYTFLDQDDRTAWQWAEIMSVPGKPIAVSDAWIAAAALRHSIPLLTHNRKHFEQISGLILLP